MVDLLVMWVVFLVMSFGAGMLTALTVDDLFQVGERGFWIAFAIPVVFFMSMCIDYTMRGAY